MKLLVAALDAELVAFPESLPGFDRLVTGPGKLKATYALTRALDARPYDEILVVGTAGALDPTMAAGIYEITIAVQHDVSDIDGVVGRHISLPPQIDFAAAGAPTDTLAGTARIATGDRFVDDADEVAAIRRLDARLVDMEAYAYGWVAEQFGVPIRIWKAISDRAQDNAITDWRTAVTACSHELRDRVRAEYGV